MADHDCWNIVSERVLGAACVCSIARDAMVRPRAMEALCDLWLSIPRPLHASPAAALYGMIGLMYRRVPKFSPHCVTSVYVIVAVTSRAREGLAWQARPLSACTTH